MLTVALLLVGFAATVRIRTTLDDEGFDREQAEGLLRSDPALLYYFTERITEANGGVPEDFRADPRIEHPELVDVPAAFSVGQEFVVAWSFLLQQKFGGEWPLHAWCLIVMSISAACTAVGVLLLLYELGHGLPRGRRLGIASLAAVCFVLLPANYRTLGFLLVREDLAIPLLSFALWAVARAHRSWSFPSGAMAAVLVVAALATWHAMGFAVAVLLGVSLVWFLRTGRGPWPGGSRIWPFAVLGLGLLVPLLWARGFVFSLAAQVAVGLVVAQWWESRHPPPPGSRASLTRGLRFATGFVAWLALSLVAAQWSGAGLGDYSHVFALVSAKLRYLGELPADPSVLPFGARLLWQGPFDTAELTRLGADLGLLALPETLGNPTTTLIPGPWGVLVLIALLSAGSALFRGERAAPAIAGLATVAAVVLSWLIVRNEVLAGLAVPIATGIFLLRLPRSSWASVAVALITVLPLASNFRRFVENHEISWYRPVQRTAEIRAMVDWLSRNERIVPPTAAIASDLMNSTAVLAHTRHPILLQPKYETAEARRRCEEFLEVLYGDSWDALHDYLERYDCPFLLIDRMTAWHGFAYVGGRTGGEGPPPANSLMATFYSTDARVLETVPGLQLVHRSPRHLRTDLFRLYRRGPAR